MPGTTVGGDRQAAARNGIPYLTWTTRKAEGFLWCWSCRAWKKADDFCTDRTRGSGRASRCRGCASEASTASRYGLTLDEYRSLREAGTACPICGRDGQPMEVDHDHATGKVRALLCSRCNGALGQFCDDPALLAKAIVYLEGHRG